MTASSTIADSSQQVSDRDCREFADCDQFSLPESLDRYFQRRYLVDRCVGSALLVVTSPLTLTLFALVKATSSGPGFYKQERVGLGGEVFEMIKLRSMVDDAEKPGQAIWCVKNDSRITRLGRVLRTFHMDELPQLWNVAKGEMALVGPRPERPEICESLAEEIENYYRRNIIKPGVTGLAQINLPPDQTVDDVRRKQILDLHYIDQANWWLDLRMMLATAMRMVGVKGETVMRLMRLCRRELLDQRLEASDLSDTECLEEANLEPAFVGAGDVEDADDVEYEQSESAAPRSPR